MDGWKSPGGRRYRAPTVLINSITKPVFQKSYRRQIWNYSHFRGDYRASVSSSSSSSQLSQEALIAQILSTIQPKISSAVQGALSSSTQTAGRRTVVQQVAAVPRPQAVRIAAPRPVASRPRPRVIAPSSRRVQSSSSSRGNLGEVFGNGETSVKFATPQFQFEF